MQFNERLPNVFNVKREANRRFKLLVSAHLTVVFTQGDARLVSDVQPELMPGELLKIAD